MFDFSTELILNDISKVSALTDADQTIPTGEVGVRVARLGVFYQHDSTTKRKTTNIYKRVGNAPVNEVATIDVSGVTLADMVGKVVRLSIDVRLAEGSEDAEYSRWAVHKGQPFYAEFYVDQLYATATAFAAAAAPAFNAAIKKGTNDAQLAITASTSNIVITATNEYQRILPSTVLERIESAYDDFPVTIATSAVTTAGVEGFGTWWNLIKNLRLPTIESIRFMGQHQEEHPVQGTIYNQYTLVKEAERAITGQGLVGQKVTSKTSHIIYVPQANTAAFETIVGPLVTAIETVS